MKKLSVFLIAIMAFSLAQINLASAADGPFPDVDSDHANAEAIEYLMDEGVIEGYPDGTYKPADKINRAEFTKIVMGPIITDMTKKNCFPDVNEDWFAPYVCDAVDKGIIEGYPDGTFKPADEINFSEATKIIAKAYNITLGDVSTDATRWYKPFVEGLETNNAIPLSVEFFDEEITRDEMAEMIYRLDAKVDEKATRTYNEIIGEGFVTVDTCAELIDRYDSYNYDYPYSRYDLMEEGEVDGIAPPAAAPGETNADDGAMMDKAAEGAIVQTTGGGGSGADDFSMTNVQIEGVDEADVIKNDGKYIYLIKGSTLRIIEAYPVENLEELISFTLGEENETFTPQEMYVYEDKLIAVGHSTMEYAYDEEIDPLDEFFYPSNYYSERTKVYVVDITDRTKPTVERSVEFDGNYNTSRRIGDTLYMVMLDYPYYYYRGSDNIVPSMIDSAKGDEEYVAGCSDIKILPKPDQFNFLITAAIPLDDLEKEVDREVIAGNAEKVFASTNNLYVSATDWSGGYYHDYWDNDSALYKFELGDGTIKFKAQGKVPGTILNQFSMDEADGNFRVATTEDAYTPGVEMTNNLFILDEDLDPLGELEDLAPGEEIKSVRFIGDRGYIVTFKRVDPLFVIDVSDPKNPTVLGKLKIPGYSTYLHPFDENHLLGFGKEVDEEMFDEEDDFVYYDAVQGMKIGLFDVTDVNHPKELFKEVIGDQGTYSELLDNHKALLFDKEKELLAFPITVYQMPDEANCSENTYSNCPGECRAICVPSSCSYDNGITVCTTDCDGEDSCVPSEYVYPDPVFEGAYVYNINLEDGFTLLGKITHYSEDEQTDLADNGYTYYEKAIKRILYMGEYLYTVSFDVVKANALDDLEELNMIELAGDVYNIYYDYFWE